MTGDLRVLGQRKRKHCPTVYMNGVRREADIESTLTGTLKLDMLTSHD